MSEGWRIGLVCVAVFLFLACGVGDCMYGYPRYKIYSQTKRGEAALRESEWNRKIRVEEAKAKQQSLELEAEGQLAAEKLHAQSEVERAKGVAEANKIIGESLRDNESYLRYLWVKGLHDGSSEVIYVPTEGNLPILEAGKR